MEINMSYDASVTNRETYDFLQFVGDLGGFMEAIMIEASFETTWTWQSRTFYLVKIPI